MPELQKSIIALAGLPFSGKTTIGRALSAEFNVPFFDIDETRQEIQPGNEWLGAEQEKAIMLRAYERNHAKAAEALELGKAAILAATYSRANYHDMLRELVSTHKVPFYFIFLETPNDEQIADRMQQRIANGSPSNVTSLEAFNEVKDRYNSFNGSELTTIKTSVPLPETLGQITAAIT